MKKYKARSLKGAERRVRELMVQVSYLKGLVRKLNAKLFRKKEQP